MRSAGSSRSRVIAHLVVARPTLHGGDAMILRSSDHVGNVSSPRIPLQWRFRLMTIQASWMLEDALDLGPRSQALVVSSLLSHHLPSSAE
jgi:hypothetical protein